MTKPYHSINKHHLFTILHIKLQITAHSFTPFNPPRKGLSNNVLDPTNLIFFRRFVSLRPFEELAPFAPEFGIGGMMEGGSIFGRSRILVRLVDGDVERQLALLQRHLVMSGGSVRSAMPSVDGVVVMKTHLGRGSGLRGGCCGGR